MIAAAAVPPHTASPIQGRDKPSPQRVEALAALQQGRAHTVSGLEALAAQRQPDAVAAFQQAHDGLKAVRPSLEYSLSRGSADALLTASSQAIAGAQQGAGAGTLSGIQSFELMAIDETYLSHGAARDYRQTLASIDQFRQRHA